MSLTGLDGLRLDQAPPLRVPAAFFLAVPVAMMAAGALLATEGAPALSSAWGRSTLALVHLGTLGVLAIGMIGALYQMTPVVASIPVPAIRMAGFVHASLTSGLALFVAGLLGGPAWALGAGTVLLGVGFTVFLGPMAVALARAPARGDTVTGMRLAVLALVGVAALGVRLALGHAGIGLLPPRDLWLVVHFATGLCGWAGGLIAAVSWQVVPMFYLAPQFSRGATRPVVAGVALGLLGLWGILGAYSVGLVDGPSASAWAAPAALPAALAVWGIHPATVLVALRRRRRKLVDGTARFWWAAMTTAPLVLALAVAARLGADPRWAVAFGWVAVWGWAGTLLHGMLARIVPFLVWFHRFSPQLGKGPVPAMRQLWPDARVRIGLGLHVASTVCGLVAIGTGVDAIARVAGVLVLATGAWLGGCLVATLLRRPVETL